MGYCDDCGNTFCICDRKTKDSYPFRMKVKELEAKLQVAVEALKFYGDGKHYYKDGLSHGDFSNWEIRKGSDGETHTPVTPGKCARLALEKIKAK